MLACMGVGADYMAPYFGRMMDLWAPKPSMFSEVWSGVKTVEPNTVALGWSWGLPGVSSSGNSDFSWHMTSEVVSAFQVEKRSDKNSEAAAPP